MTSQRPFGLLKVWANTVTWMRWNGWVGGVALVDREAAWRKGGR